MTLHICTKVLLPVVLNTIFTTLPYPLNTATSYDKKICIKGKRIHLFLCIFFILGCQIHVHVVPNREFQALVFKFLANSLKSAGKFFGLKKKVTSELNISIRPKFELIYVFPDYLQVS